jgi:protein ImuB
MPRLYACVVSPAETAGPEVLTGVAAVFAATIETVESGVLFDISGLERLIGPPDEIAKKISMEMLQRHITGSIGIAETADAAVLLARDGRGLNVEIRGENDFPQLPLAGLDIDRDTLGVFHDLGIYRVEDLLAIPREELAGRYGREFDRVIKQIERRGPRLLTPNVRDSSVTWRYELDHPVEDFEHLIFIVNHGLDHIFGRVERSAMSTEQVDIGFTLEENGSAVYEIKTSFPTLEKAFWLKLISLRVAADPPPKAILSIEMTSHFTKPRPSQRGLYAVSKPEPESLFLTVGKLQKLVGNDNVGVPEILNERLVRPFTLHATRLPAGTADAVPPSLNAVIAHRYFIPPLAADVLVRDERLVYVRTTHFRGRVIEYSGVWRANSKWWDRTWRIQEWDIEIEDGGTYRLAKAAKKWFVIGEYD